MRKIKSTRKTISEKENKPPPILWFELGKLRSSFKDVVSQAAVGDRHLWPSVRWLSQVFTICLEMEKKNIFQICVVSVDV